MATTLATRLVLDALNMALMTRRPRGVIHHSAQYTSIEFGHRCREAGVRPSMGSVGDAYDNAMCESFFATLDRDAHQPAAVLAAVKDKPFGRPPQAAVLDRRCARQPRQCAGRDGRMGPPGAELKNATKPEDNMT
jgi:transposase InsO family protein